MCWPWRALPRAAVCVSLACVHKLRVQALILVDWLRTILPSNHWTAEVDTMDGRSLCMAAHQGETCGSTDSSSNLGSCGAVLFARSTTARWTLCGRFVQQPRNHRGYYCTVQFTRNVARCPPSRWRMAWAALHRMLRPSVRRAGAWTVHSPGRPCFLWRTGR